MTRTITKAILSLLLLGLIFAPFAGLAPLLILLLIAAVIWSAASFFPNGPEDIDTDFSS